MEKTTLTLGHSPDPDDAFMFYALAKDLIPTHGFHFQHILQDIQTLNERATRGELDITAVSIHAYAYVSDKYALLPSGASMGDGYGPMLVAKQKFSREEIAKKKIAVPGTMTSAFLALQLWLGKPAKEFNYVVVPFDQIFSAVKNGTAEIGLIIHEGQLTFQNEKLVLMRRPRHLVGKTKQRPAVAARRKRHPQKICARVTRRKFPTRSPRASSSAWIIARKPCSTRCNTPATWAATSPTNSWGCMSTTGRWTTANGAGNPSAVFSAKVLSAACFRTGRNSNSSSDGPAK